MEEEEDDDDDKELVLDASIEAGINISILFVENEEELMDILLQHNRYSQNNEKLFPVLILLDLNMPKLDCKKVFVKIKKD